MTQTQTEQTSKEQVIAKQATSVKTYVLDTTVLINNPDIVSKLNGKVVVPIAVIGQLDGLKKNENINIAQRARQASRAILEAQTKGKVEIMNNFKKGIKTLDSEADNKIIGTCLTLKEQGEDVNLLTTDVNMQITARSIGVGTEQGERKVNKVSYIFASLISVLLISVGILIALGSLIDRNSPLEKFIFSNTNFHFILILMLIFSLIGMFKLFCYLDRKGICNDSNLRSARNSILKRKSDWYPGGPDPTMPGDIGYIDPN